MNDSPDPVKILSALVACWCDQRKLKPENLEIKEVKENDDYNTDQDS